MISHNSITMIDYGGSNLRSVQKAFEAVGRVVAVTDDPAVVARGTKLVLPGVGAFGAGIDALRQRGLDTTVIEAVAQGAQLLGICLGMQFLFDFSEEMGMHRGLGLLPGGVLRFPADAAGQDDRPLKVPHIGWNRLEHTGDHPLLNGVAPGAHAYFVHSYFCDPADPAITLAHTNYGRDFPAVVGRGNVFGLQFHPEKSQHVGLQILRNFADLPVDLGYTL